MGETTALAVVWWHFYCHGHDICPVWFSCQIHPTPALVSDKIQMALQHAPGSLNWPHRAAQRVHQKTRKIYIYNYCDTAWNTEQCLAGLTIAGVGIKTIQEPPSIPRNTQPRVQRPDTIRCPPGQLPAFKIPADVNNNCNYKQAAHSCAL